MRLNKRAIHEAVAAYLFLLPSFVGLVVFVVLPIIKSFLLSFHNWDLLGAMKWNGLKNYRQLIKDPFFIDSLKNTAYFSFVSVPCNICIGLFLAVMLNQKIRGVKTYRVVYFLPVVCSTVAVALIWQWLYDKDFGVVNYLLNKIGLPGVPWLTSFVWAMPAVILVAVWKGIGYNMVIFLAGLQGVPAELYEAAKIDGANAWARFWHVTLPMISPTTFFITVMSLIGSFQVFDVTMVLTGGGPGTATITLVQYIYRCAFEFFRMGYASAIAYVLFAIVLLFTLIQLGLSKKWVHYQ
ncbi:MAG: sugar ABC transporter permease [Firmicutes bacterium]|nr:sugar ABC transporter permease [Bacillota bacterium]